MIPISPCEPNVMLFHPLVAKICAIGLGQTKMAHSLTTIGRHLECAIQTELVVEPDIGILPLLEGSNLVDFNTILSHAIKIYKRVLPGWHCAKVKARSCIEIKIEKKQSKD